MEVYFCLLLRDHYRVDNTHRGAERVCAESILRTTPRKSLDKHGSICYRWEHNNNEQPKNKLTVPSKSNRAERVLRLTVTARRIGVPSSMKSSALTVPTCQAKTKVKVEPKGHAISYHAMYIPAWFGQRDPKQRDTYAEIKRVADSGIQKHLVLLLISVPDTACHRRISL